MFADAQITSKPARGRHEFQNDISRSNVTQLCRITFNSWTVKVQIQFLKVSGINFKLGCLEEDSYQFYEQLSPRFNQLIWLTFNKRNFPAIDPGTKQWQVKSYTLFWWRFNIYPRKLFSKEIRVCSCLWGLTPNSSGNPLKGHQLSSSLT